MPAHRKISMQQMEALIAFLEEHRALAKGQAINTPQAKAAVKRLWDELASLLNGQGMGTSKNGSQWREYWRDLKYRVRKKAGDREVDRRRTGGGPPSSVGLSALEERIYSIMGDRSVVGDVTARIPFDLDEVPPTPAGLNSPPSPATEMHLHFSPDAPLSPYGPPCSPAQPQPSTSTAPPVHESPSAAVFTVSSPPAPAAKRRKTTGKSSAPAAKRRKTTGKSTPVEIPQPRWAWEAEQRRLDVDERRLVVEERRVALEERAVVAQERIASALEAIASDTAAIRQRL